MNDKDKEAFEKWYKNLSSGSGKLTAFDDVWQAACEYKQKEIDDLEKIVLKQNQENDLLWASNKKLQDENAKLKKFISVLGHDDQVVDDVIKALEKLEKMEYE